LNCNERAHWNRAAGVNARIHPLDESIDTSTVQLLDSAIWNSAIAAK
jgi:hypothetical protein